MLKQARLEREEMLKHETAAQRKKRERKEEREELEEEERAQRVQDEILKEHEEQQGEKEEAVVSDDFDFRAAENKAKGTTSPAVAGSILHTV